MTGVTQQWGTMENSLLYSGWSASTIGWRQVGGEAVTVRLRLFRRDQQFGWEFPEDAIEFAYGFDGAQIAPPDNPDSCSAPTRDSRGSRLHGRARARASSIHARAAPRPWRRPLAQGGRCWVWWRGVSSAPSSTVRDRWGSARVATDRSPRRRVVMVGLDYWV